MSDWCDSRPCFGYNAQQVNTHTHIWLHLGCNSHLWKLCLGGAGVCACSWNSGEGESIPSPSDFLLHCTKLWRKDTPCTEQHTVSHQKISSQSVCTRPPGLMRSPLHAVMAAGENWEREPALETDRHLYWNPVFPLCHARRPCTAQYVFLLECGQSTYLSRQVSFVYRESRMAEERVQDRRFWLESALKTVFKLQLKVVLRLFVFFHQSLWACLHALITHYCE